MLGFFEGFRDLVTPGGCEDSEARREALLLKLDTEGSTGNEAGLPSRLASGAHQPTSRKIRKKQNHGRGCRELLEGA